MTLRKSIILLLAALATHANAVGSDNVSLLTEGRVMVLGDSITQGGQYVSFLEYFLEKEHPAAKLDVVSVGLASETTSGLSEAGHAGGAFPRPCVHERLQRALDAVKPAVVVACYGMNDGIYQLPDEGRLKAFRDGMTRLVDRCRAAGAKVVLVTPPVYDARGAAAGTASARYDADVLGKFAEWEVKTPPPGVAAVADLHAAMAAALAERQKANPGFHFAGDGVHPNELGHLVMALSILKELKIAVPAGTPEALLPIIKADPLFALVASHRATRSEGWLSYIGYTREKKVAPGTGNIAAVEARAAKIQEQVDALRKVEKAK
jgi:lysophospholipase L1-like esterase